ncbi:MAG: hypothetical protein AAF850_00320 [Pseudomonadota bacterium]
MMKFIASNAESAKAKARRALGDAAVIVSMRDLPSGDVEVTASDRPHPAAPVQNTDMVSPGATVSRDGYGDDARRALEHDARPDGGSGSRLNEALEQRVAEDALSRLKNSLAGAEREQQLDLSDAKARALHEVLAHHGLGDGLMAAIIHGAHNARAHDDFRRFEEAIAAAFGFAPLTVAGGPPIMLVGPTGAGKTSSSAKIAKAAMEAGVGAFMMTADVGRAGAAEQIKTYGDTLGADYFIVEAPQDVQRAINEYHPTGVIILDTPGVSPFDPGDIAALRSFQEAAQAEPVLVLPASGDAAEYEEWACAFAEFGVRRMIITKFDATRRVGAALGAAHKANMNLANFSEAAFISEGLLPASADFLARRLLAANPGRYA